MLECNNCEARYGSLAPDPTQRQGLPMSAMHPVATKILPRRDWSLCADFVEKVVDDLWEQ